MPAEQILLVYDRECPVCNAYCQMARIDNSAGDLVIVDAREPTQVLSEITEQRLDIDQGMVLKMGNELYYGADAINALALIRGSMLGDGFRNGLACRGSGSRGAPAAAPASARLQCLDD